MHLSYTIQCVKITEIRCLMYGIFIRYNDLTDVKPINNRDHLLPTDQLDLKEAPCSVDDSVQLCHVLSCDRCLLRDPGVREFSGTLAPKCASYTVSILAEHTRPLDKKFDIGL